MNNFTNTRQNKSSQTAILQAQFDYTLSIFRIDYHPISFDVEPLVNMI